MDAHFTYAMHGLNLSDLYTHIMRKMESLIDCDGKFAGFSSQQSMTLTGSFLTKIKTQSKGKEIKYTKYMEIFEDLVKNNGVKTK